MPLTFSSMHALSLHMVVRKNAESKLMEKIREGKCEFPIGFKHYFVVQSFFRCYFLFTEACVSSISQGHWTQLFLFSFVKEKKK